MLAVSTLPVSLLPVAQVLSDLFDAWPQEVTATVVRLAGEKRRPLLSPEDLTGLLAKAGVPDFAERLRARLGQTDRS